MLRWRADTIAEGMRQRVFTTPVRGVPGVLWTPDARPGPFPLALIGHGGAGHKLDDSRLDLARRYVRAGVAAAAIDGPWHGERAGQRPESWSEATVDAMVADWRETLEALLALDEVDGARVGYGGVSMGTMLGLPFVAGEPRIRAATLGLCGLREASGDPLEIAERLRTDAARLDRPVLFLVQWNDEVFDVESCVELWAALGSEEKSMLVNPGGHGETPESAREAGTRFLIARLTA